LCRFGENSLDYAPLDRIAFLSYLFKTNERAKSLRKICNNQTFSVGLAFEPDSAGAGFQTACLQPTRTTPDPNSADSRNKRKRRGRWKKTGSEVTTKKGFWNTNYH
jgi:hypothetical protein